MIEHDVEQGSADWLSIRLGIPTASMAHKILTPKTQKFSAQARGYAFRLVAEKLMNESLDSLDYIDHIQRGKDLEPQAVRMFELVEDIETRPSGFLTTNDLKVGATPDRIVIGMSAALEVKCPSAWVHLEYLVDGFDSDYIIQVQCQAFVGEFDWVARYSYHPSLPPRLEKMHRDDGLIKKLQEALTQFHDVRGEIEAKVRASGFIEERRHIITEADRIAASLDVLAERVEIETTPPVGVSTRTFQDGILEQLATCRSVVDVIHLEGVYKRQISALTHGEWILLQSRIDARKEELAQAEEAMVRR